MQNRNTGRYEGLRRRIKTKNLTHGKACRNFGSLFRRKGVMSKTTIRLCAVMLLISGSLLIVGGESSSFSRTLNSCYLPSVLRRSGMGWYDFHILNWEGRFYVIVDLKNCLYVETRKLQEGLSWYFPSTQIMVRTIKDSNKKAPISVRYRGFWV